MNLLQRLVCCLTVLANKPAGYLVYLNGLEFCRESVMKIAIGADLYGFPLKESVKEYLKSKDYEITDYGVNKTSDPTPYYTTAGKVAKSLCKGT